MISVSQLSFSYGRTRILQDVSFDVAEGEFLAVLGRNGAGKSTLVKCLNRILHPDAGSIVLGGKPLGDYSRADLAKTVAYVAQSTDTTRMTVFDSVLLGRKPYLQWAISDDDIRLCSEVLELVGMSDKQLRMTDSLSGGEMQKVMLARALVQQPAVLILDEPTNNLDPRSQYEMIALVKKIAQQQGFTVIVVLHDLNIVLRYCSSFLFLHESTTYAHVQANEVDEKIFDHVYGIRSTLATVGGHRVIAIDVPNL